jgi:hypothetical protein
VEAIALWLVRRRMHAPATQVFTRTFATSIRALVAPHLYLFVHLNIQNMENVVSKSTLDTCAHQHVYPFEHGLCAYELTYVMCVHGGQADHFFVANNPDELSFEDGDVLLIHAEDVEPGWVTAELRNKKGLAPLTHITLPKNPVRVPSASEPVMAYKKSGLSDGPGGASDVDRALEEMRSVVDRVLQETSTQNQNNRLNIVQNNNRMGSPGPHALGGLREAKVLNVRSASPGSLATAANRVVVPPLHNLGQLSAPAEGPSRGFSAKPDSSAPVDEEGLKLTRERLAMLPFIAVAGYEYDANDSDELSFSVCMHISMISMYHVCTYQSICLSINVSVYLNKVAFICAHPWP